MEKEFYEKLIELNDYLINFHDIETYRSFTKIDETIKNKIVNYILHMEKFDYFLFNMFLRTENIVNEIEIVFGHSDDHDNQISSSFQI